MKHPLSLHHVTAMEVGPAELVSIAAEIGCQHVCLFTQVAEEAKALFPCDWPPSVRREVKQRCDDTGISAFSLEYFDVFPGIDLNDYRQGLEIGAELGARCATTHVNAEDTAWAIDNFAKFCEIASEYGISPSIEFTSLAGPPNLQSAVQIINAADCDNGGIALDTLHLFRNGGCVADIAALDKRLLKSVQISDGPLSLTAGLDYQCETLFERQIPGMGEFPLRELSAHFPDGMVVDTEVPLNSLRDSGVDALERARLAVQGTRNLLMSVK